LLPPLARIRLAVEPFVRPARSSADESVASFFARRFGRATVPLIAAPLLGGIHAGKIDLLSMQSLFPRFVDAERSRGSVLRAFHRSHAGAAGSDGAFRSLSSGMGELVSAIGRRLPPGSVRLASGAGTLSKTADGWRVGTPQGSVDARSVVLAAPAYAAARMLTSVDQESSALCAAVQYVSSVSVAIAFSREQVGNPLAGSGFVVARTSDAPRLTACTWISSKWAGRAPQGSVLLRAFLGSATDPSAIDLSDDELIDIVRRELSSVLRISGAPLLARVDRWRDGGAQHNVGHIERMARLEARLGRHPGLFVAGSGFRAVGIPDCVTDGRSAAAAAAEFVRERASSEV
jgi:oxygen-dependent protoporphyrinogen oxidase